MNCEKQFLIFEYLYRDGGNYKAWGEIRLSGKLTKNQIEEIHLNPCSPKFTFSPQAWPLIF